MSKEEKIKASQSRSQERRITKQKGAAATKESQTGLSRFASAKLDHRHSMNPFDTRPRLRFQRNGSVEIRAAGRIIPCATRGEFKRGLEEIRENEASLRHSGAYCKPKKLVVDDTEATVDRQAAERLSRILRG